MQAPVIFVVGPVGHGKTTSREILSRITHLKGGSCSDVIYAVLAARRGVSVQSLRDPPKEELRPTLIEVGDWMCGQIGQLTEVAAKPEVDETIYRSPSALIRTLYMNGYNVIDGVRRKLELQHAQEHLEWNGVRSVVIHVHDPRKPLIADNSEDLTPLSDNQIVNDGTPGELEEKLFAVLDQHFPGAVQRPAPTPETPPAIEPAQVPQEVSS
jgi:hypothetical protein